MAYKIMKNLIANNKKTNEELLNMADVYYAAGRLNDDEYTDIINRINNRQESGEMSK